MLWPEVEKKLQASMWPSWLLLLHKLKPTGSIDPKRVKKFKVRMMWQISIRNTCGFIPKRKISARYVSSADGFWATSFSGGELLEQGHCIQWAAASRERVCSCAGVSTHTHTTLRLFSCLFFSTMPLHSTV